MSTLTFIIAWPLLAALIIGMIPANFRFVIRLVALGATLLSMLFAIYAFWSFDAGSGVVQFEEKRQWVSALGIEYYVGADGINIGLILMAAIVAFAATAACWEIKDRAKYFYILLMIMVGGIFGAFASLDLFFFFFFHELALIPTFIMIGIWGRGENKNYATFNMTIYLSLGALLALVGLVAVYVQAGGDTFNMIELANRLRADPLSSDAQHFIFPFLLFGFGILVSLWPFHTWAPLGYGAAPTATAMLHAGVLKKFGLYGLIRVALPMLPEAVQTWGGIIAALCLGNLLYVGFVAMRQRDLNQLIGHSSVAHMGFVFLGIATFSLVGVTGAVMVMVAHGLLAALSFATSGYLYSRMQTLDMHQMGGLGKRIPFLAVILVMMAMAGCGLPGFANFVGEVMVFFAAWEPFPVVTVIAVWSALVIGAVYMLRAVRGIVHGPLHQRWVALEDVTGAWRKTPFLILVAALLVFGFFPRLLTDKIKLSAQVILSSRPVAQAVVESEEDPAQGSLAVVESDERAVLK